mgnify:CR=1 FL=1
MNTRRINPNAKYQDPFFIGFDTIFNQMNNFNGSSDRKYPPYNILKLGEDMYLLEMAVAGFDEDDFDITLQEGVLTIRGDVSDSVDEDAQYIHKGIATRSFTRTFSLANTIRVDKVTLDKGVLTIRLVNILPEEKKPQKFTVNADEEAKSPTDQIRG